MNYKFNSMTQEELLEYNKRCALFLGAIDNTHSWGFMLEQNQLNLSFELFDENIFSNDGGSGWFLKDLKFHSDWSWIMEVVEAIEKLFDHPNKEINVDIKAGQIEIFQRPYRLENNDYHEIIYLGDGYINGSKKEAVVQAINQFLIWYNEIQIN